MGCQNSKELQKSRHHLSENVVVEHHKNVQDDYNIIKQIGKGSIGIIYLAESKRPKYYEDESRLLRQSSSTGGQSPDNRKRIGRQPTVIAQYAIKEIDTDTLERGAFESLKKEIALLTTLDHPFIIKFFESYSTVKGGKERLSVVMELCTGGPLDKFVPYDEDTAVILVANIVEAILYLHHHNVVHHDLKVRAYSYNIIGRMVRRS